MKAHLQLHLQAVVDSSRVKRSDSEIICHANQELCTVEEEEREHTSYSICTAHTHTYTHTQSP